MLTLYLSGVILPYLGFSMDSYGEVGADLISEASFNVSLCEVIS